MILGQSIAIKIPHDSTKYASNLNYIPFRRRESHLSIKSNHFLRNELSLKPSFTEEQIKNKNNNISMKSKHKFITFSYDEKI
jgi:hypothetical protein